MCWVLRAFRKLPDIVTSEHRFASVYVSCTDTIEKCHRQYVVRVVQFETELHLYEVL